MSIYIREEEGENILFSFAKKVGGKIINGRLNIPAAYGTGYVRAFTFKNYLRLVVRHYNLKEKLIIKRESSNVFSKMVMISINDILSLTGTEAQPVKKRKLPSVTIATQGLEPEVIITGNTSFNSIRIAVDATYLKDSLDVNTTNSILNGIIDNNQPYVFEHFVSLQIQQVVSEITTSDFTGPMQKVYYRLKTEELICYLFAELLNRENESLHAINITDMTALYAVKDKLIKDLSEAPSLPELASFAAMSESKLKRLFKQVFGKTVYDYFQTVRMKQAASLLIESKLSVSEVGYRLGFSNLSHFARVFEEHIGMKPKKFSAGQIVSK